MKRDEILSALRAKPEVDVLIIGAGINGVGVFHDLAMQGVDVLLVDQGDFCAGASAASSHMAHGGIRYLENGEFRLVREAVHERNRLIKNAPHIVRPLPTVIPIFKFFSGLLNAPLKFLNLLDRPSERGAFVIKVGLMLYDAFTRNQATVPPHTFYGKTPSLGRWPKLNPEVKWTAVYYDGSIASPERLTVELVLDGENAGPNARALNYAKLETDPDGSLSLVLRDHSSAEFLPIKPKIVINAAGPWIDRVNAKLKVNQRYIGGTKGSHIVVEHPELRQAIGENEFFFENKDGRIVLLFPFFDKVLIGTSDIPIEDPDSARCTNEEVTYFIQLVQRVFPSIEVKPEHIVFRFSGVRPLAYSKAKTAGQITRDHITQEDRIQTPGGEIPVFSLVGGKWTTYRAFAEQVTDRVLMLLDYQRKVSTANLGIGGGKDYPVSTDARNKIISHIQECGGISAGHAAALFDRYGTRAIQVSNYLSSGVDSPLEHLAGWTKREVCFAIEQEKALKIEDLLIRRSTIAWLNHANHALILELADIFADVLGWGAEMKKEAISSCLTTLSEYHGVKLVS